MEDTNLTQEGSIVKDNFTRRVTFKNVVLRDLMTMASHYYFDKNVKQDELLSIMLEDVVNHYYQTKFLKDLNKSK